MSRASALSVEDLDGTVAFNKYLDVCFIYSILFMLFALALVLYWKSKLHTDLGFALGLCVWRLSTGTYFVRVGRAWASLIEKNPASALMVSLLAAWIPASEYVLYPLVKVRVNQRLGRYGVRPFWLAAPTGQVRQARQALLSEGSEPQS